MSNLCVRFRGTQEKRRGLDGFVKRHKKNKRKKSLCVNGLAANSVIKQRSLDRSVRAIHNRPITRRIIAQTKLLRRRIKVNAQLRRDFDFLSKKTGWHPDKLLQSLYWDCNMMHADLQTLLSNIKSDIWPMDRQTVEMILRNLTGLPEQIQRVNETEFSPARTCILRDSEGTQLRLKQQRDLQEAFIQLPDVLRFFGGELQRKFNIADHYWQTEREEWKAIVDVTRQSSLYQGIRLATRDNKYNANRLCRLVNASRAVQGLQPIKLRAFTIWLNKLRKRQSNQMH